MNLINTLTFSILVFLLAWHIVRLVKIWRAIHTVSLVSTLFILALALQLMALCSDQRWGIWGAALILVVIAVWRFWGAGTRIVPLENVFANLGVSNSKSLRRIWELCKDQRTDEGMEQSARRVDQDRRKSWWKAFAVEARPRVINFVVDLPELIELKTVEQLPLTLGPGKVQMALGGWEILPVEGESYEIRLRIWVTDAACIVWTSEYRAEIETLVDIGFSSTPKRRPDELFGWTEINPEWERTFRENCLIAKAVYHTDRRDLIEARIGSHHYVVHTKYKRGVIDLAWDDESSQVLLRLAGLLFRERDGISIYDLETNDEEPDSDALPWEPDYIEPVVFPILPEELLPFGMNGLMSPYRFDENVEFWPPLFSRCAGREIGDGPAICSPPAFTVPAP